jgi:hypothetical protein
MHVHDINIAEASIIIDPESGIPFRFEDSKTWKLKRQIKPIKQSLSLTKYHTIGRQQILQDSVITADASVAINTQRGF